jgi:hypothetical protein
MALIALPRAVLGPVELAHGLWVRLRSARRARRSGVQPFDSLRRRNLAFNGLIERDIFVFHEFDCRIIFQARTTFRCRAFRLLAGGIWLSTD